MPGVCVRRAREHSGKAELAFMLFSKYVGKVGPKAWSICSLEIQGIHPRISSDRIEVTPPIPVYSQAWFYGSGLPQLCSLPLPQPWEEVINRTAYRRVPQQTATAHKILLTPVGPRDTSFQG